MKEVDEFDNLIKKLTLWYSIIGFFFGPVLYDMSPFWHRVIDGCFIFILASIAFLYGIEGRVLRRASEGRVARVAQEILDTNDWIVPHLNGVPRIKKPPGSSWLVAATAVVASGVDRDSGKYVIPMHALFPSACASILMMILVFWWASTGASFGGARRPEDFGATARNRGLLAALALGMMPAFLGQGRSAEMDMLVALCAAVAFFLWERWWFRSSIFSLIGFYGALACGFLIKGHVVLLVVGIPICFWILMERRHALNQIHPSNRTKRTLWWHLLGGGLALTIILLWGIPFLLNSGITWNDFEKEGLNRFGSRTGHQESFVFYFLNVPSWCLPWFLAIPLVAWWDWRIWKQEKSGKQSSAEGRNVYARRRLWWCWFGVNLLLWSLLSAKQRHYTVPWLTPLALLVGDGLVRMFSDKDSDIWVASARYARWAGVLILGIMGVLSSALIIWMSIIGGNHWSVQLLLVVAAVFFGVGTWSFGKQINRWPYWAMGAAWACLVIVYVNDGEKAEDARQSPKAFCQSVSNHVPEAATLFDVGVASKDAAVLFYLGRNVSPVKAELSQKERALSKPDRQRLIFVRRLEQVRALLIEKMLHLAVFRAKK